MRQMVHISGGCETYPNVTQLERPAGGILGDVWIRGVHSGANVWIFTAHNSLADAQSGDNPVGVAGSQFPEDSGLWPFNDNGAVPPDSSNWVLHATLPSTPPDGACVSVWHWTTAYNSNATQVVCDVLSEYTGPGKALDGVTVQCGDPGEHHPGRLVYVVTSGSTPKPGARAEAVRMVGVKIVVKVSRMEQVAAAKSASEYQSTIVSILHDRRAEIGSSGRIEWTSVTTAEADPTQYMGEILIGVRESMTREG